MAAGFPVAVFEDTVTVRAHGELDLVTAEALKHALAEALRHASPTRPVLVDFSQVTFCDSAGLNALITARIAAETDGTRICLTGLNHQVHRLLEVTGTLPLFTVNP
ncbi:STAS domain-containing protein [Streptomyces sp. NRRL F-2747]|uniref:STAS domain-containing protein n=1 Tax=Streptomyces sp. NRRL F-2747 TaxID=1463843 RepID=UPI00131E4D17|nr:STAS domain-containing protein [Streptomyces sp. NRRL F-2747]